MSTLRQDEAPLEPALPIIDPHLHLWEIPAVPGGLQLPQRFLLHEALEVIAGSGHNIVQTVFAESRAMYRADGPDELRCVGETEFANGIAAMSASGQYGPCRIAAGIIGSVDMLLGRRVEPVLDAHLAAAGERFRGVRFPVAYSESGLFGRAADPALKSLLLRPEFLDGARVLASKGLSLDVWCLHTQLDELIALATALPNLQIVLDHLGTPESQGVYANCSAEAEAEWKAAITELARRPNVAIKLGGLGMDITGPIGFRQRNATSEVLAEEWRWRLETCISAFTPQRSMFESNFPPDSAAGSYGAVWNAFKRVTASYSADEKAALFAGTAKRIYRLPDAGCPIADSRMRT